MNTKLERTIREIERTKEKIAGLQALLPELEKQKTELENAEVIKAFRSADVAPADFTAFIEAYKTNGELRIKNTEQATSRFLTPDSTFLTDKEDADHEKN